MFMAAFSSKYAGGSHIEFPDKMDVGASIILLL